MTHARHTPGPWTLPVGVIGPDKVWDSEGEREICAFIDNEADAHLIAAAPELLAALQRVVSTIDIRNMTPAERAIMGQCSAAIAKATGVDQ